MKNKITAIFLSFAMIITIFSFTVFSAFAADGSDYSYYIESSGGLTLTDYTGSDTEIVIPTSIGGHLVTGIAENTFDHSRDAVSITIPQYVEDINTYAFTYCNKLTQFIVDENNEAFYSVDGVLYNKIRKSLFRYPAGKPATEFTVPDGISYIECNAFYACVNLKNIILNEGITDIGENAFYGLINLETIEVDKANVHYISENGVLFNNDKSSLLLYPMGKENGSYTVPNKVKKILDNTFLNCTELTDIVVLPSVTSIGKYAIGYYIYNGSFQKVPNFTIYGYSNTAAKTYAEENGFNFVELISGDADLNAIVEITDARLVLQYTVGLVTLNCAQQITADLNQNGNVTIVDARMILKSIVNK